MIVIQGKSRKSLALANYINNNIEKNKKVVVFDSVGVPNLAFQIKRDYEHFTFNHSSLEELIKDLQNENAEEIIQDCDVIVFECNISPDQLSLINESDYKQDIIVTVQTDEEVKVIDTNNVE